MKNRENSYDLVIQARGRRKLKIVHTRTKYSEIVDLNQFSGKEYGYDEIVWGILRDYLNGVTVQFTRSAKKAIQKQADKNKQG